jgi:hypothetical protein
VNRTAALPEINGTEPLALGQTCTGLAVIACYEGSALDDPANVTYLRFGEAWHRIYFEPGIVFWRSGDGPQQPVNSSLESGLVLNDLSELPAVDGHTLLGIEYTANEAGDVAARFRFEGGAELRLTYSAQAGATQIEA